MSQDGHPQSLLSLSIAAATAAPSQVDSLGRLSQGTPTKHRRLSSAGRSGRRRLSDARDAATRPFPTSLQTASASLAALSLSSPAVSQRPVVGGAQPIQVPRAIPSAKGTPDTESGSVDDAPSLGSKLGRKRGTTFTCESCSKVYRHPSCLIKHRWEHTPQWREASKYVLSKHQQVQLLEAAAILSHLSPSSASLPEDRSLWPSFLSGGLVPPPASANDVAPTTSSASPLTSTPNVHASFPISSSVPATSVLSHGPRLHDYAVDGRSDLAQVRPGVLGVPTEKSSPMPMPVPAEDDALNLLALHSGTSVSSSVPLSSYSHAHARSQSYSRTRSHGHSLSLSDVPPRERPRSNAYEYVVHGTGVHDDASGSLGHRHANSSGGWSLPRSSVRSKSGSSRSRSGSHSASESRSDDEDERVFGADLEEGTEGGMDLEGPRMRRTRVFGSRMRMWKMEDEDGEGEGGVTRLSLREDTQEDEGDDLKVRRAEQTWDGMDMDMDMDM